MIRLWFLIYYLAHFPKDGYWANFNDDVERSKFKFYILLNKLLFQDIRDTFREFWHRKVRAHRESNQTAVNRGLLRLKKIDQLIDKAISKGYVIPIGHVNNQKLGMDWKGNDFLKPTNFVNEFLREYGYTVSFLSGAGGAAFIWLINHLLR